MLTEENIQLFLGVIEKEAIVIISEYAKLIAEQIIQEKSYKLKKGGVDKDTAQIYVKINDLKNIIAYENANIMNKFESWDKTKDKKDQNYLNEQLLKISPSDTDKEV